MNPPVLLYAEDDLDDRVLFTHACSRANVSFRLVSAEDGQEAVDYLSGSGRFAKRSEFPFPTGLLLDIKMPSLDGFAVLRWIRAQERFAALPVFIFTSSYQHADIQRAYEEKATAFLTKPSEFGALTRLAGALSECLRSGGIQIDPLTLLPQYKRP